MLTIIKIFFVFALSFIWVKDLHADEGENNYIISGIPSKIIDGDTFIIDNQIIKLNSIISLSIDQECLDKEIGRYNCGQVSQNVLDEITKNKIIECSILRWSDIGEKIGNCTVTESQINLSNYMLEAGWAIVRWFDRDNQKKPISCTFDKCVNIEQLFFNSEQQAVIKKRGVWSSKFDLPWNLY